MEKKTLSAALAEFAAGTPAKIIGLGSDGGGLSITPKNLVEKSSDINGRVYDTSLDNNRIYENKWYRLADSQGHSTARCSSILINFATIYNLNVPRSQLVYFSAGHTLANAVELGRLTGTSPIFDRVRILYDSASAGKSLPFCIEGHVPQGFNNNQLYLTWSMNIGWNVYEKAVEVADAVPEGYSAKVVDLTA